MRMYIFFPGNSFSLKVYLYAFVNAVGDCLPELRSFMNVSKQLYFS